GLGAGGQAVGGTVSGQVRLGVGVVVGVDDGDREAGAARRGQVVGAVQVGRGEAGGGRGGERRGEPLLDVGAPLGEAGRVARLGRGAQVGRGGLLPGLAGGVEGLALRGGQGLGVLRGPGGVGSGGRGGLGSGRRCRGQSGDGQGEGGESD